MSYKHISNEDVAQFPQLAKHVGKTIKASEFHKLIDIAKTNTAPQTEEVKEEAKEEEVKEAPKKKAPKKDK